jgi:hypothetical protein
MGIADPAGEWLRLAERYRGMTGGELIALARQNSALTPVAQQTLANEISHRGLKVPPHPQPEAAPKPTPGEPASSPYDEDRQLIEICTVWSLRDALQVQRLLDGAAIPFFLGPEKATGVDRVTSSFDQGVGVQIMRIGWPWARDAMEWYEPADDRTPREEKEALPDLPVRCPKCRSSEVVFEKLVADRASAADNSPANYKWICDSCAHEWQDDGIIKER